jgi:hypothetical protein
VISPSSASLQTVASFINPNTGNGSGAQIFIGPYSPGSPGYMASISSTGNPAGTYASNLWLQPRITGGALGNGILMNASDNVLIGSTTDNGIAKLQVTGEVSTTGWFRGTVAGVGLYNQLNGNHVYSPSANYWAMTGGGQTAGGLQFYQQYASNLRGYVYWDTSSFGLLDNGGGWRVRLGSSGASMGSYGSIDIAGATGGYEGIRFSDSTNTYQETLMINNAASGFYKEGVGWYWYIDNNNNMYGTGSSALNVPNGIKGALYN